MTFAITGASGQLGRLAADRLLERVDASQVVLLSRDPSRLSAYADRGVVVRSADFGRPETLAAAFADVERLLLISIDVLGEERVAQQRAALDAAKTAGVEHVAYTSIPRPTPDNPAGVVPDHAATEQYLRGSGLGWTMLRNNVYAHLQLDSLRQAGATGTLPTNYGNGRAGYVTRADCAAAAAAALAGESTNAVYDITGPEALGASDLAALAAAMSDKPVRAADLDDDAYRNMLTGAGLPPWAAELLTSFGRSIREGHLAEVSTAVRDLTGVEPTSLAALAV